LQHLRHCTLAASKLCCASTLQQKIDIQQVFALQTAATMLGSALSNPATQRLQAVKGSFKLWGPRPTSVARHSWESQAIYDAGAERKIVGGCGRTRPALPAQPCTPTMAAAGLHGTHAHRQAARAASTSWAEAAVQCDQLAGTGCVCRARTGPWPQRQVRVARCCRAVCSCS